MKKIILLSVFLLLAGKMVYADDFTFAPSNNITISNTNVLFKWNVFNRVIRYKVDLSSSPSMSPLLSSDSTILTSSTTIPLTSNIYYWRVSVDTGLGFNISSTVKKFTLINPTSIDSLAFWVRADNIVPSGIDTVAVWEDNSINNFDATQTTFSRRPRLEFNTLNDLPSVRFDGVDDFLSSGNVDLHINLQYSCYLIAKPDDYLASRNMFAKGATTSQGNVSLRTTSASRYSSIIDGETKTGLTNLTANKYYLFSSLLATDTTYLNINKITDLKFVPTVDYLGTNTSAFQVGASNGASFWKGNISELLIFKRKLSVTENANVENYLQDKYAPPINLGADIITCSTNQLISAKRGGSYVSYLWSTGSTDSAIRASSSGQYSVRTTDVFNRISFDTVNVLIDNNPFTVANIPDTIVCAGTALQFYAGPTHFRYLWSTGDTTNRITVTTGGLYWIRLTDCQGTISTDTFTVSQQNLSFSLGQDTTLTAGQTVNLSVFTSPSLHYLWNTGAISSAIVASANGAYWCMITDTITGCTFSDTMNVVVIGVDNNFIYYPSNNSTLSNSSINFLWNHVRNHVRYKIVIANTSTLVPILIGDSAILGSSSFQSLLPNTYYWQVVADTGFGYNIYSSIFKFDVVDLSSLDSLSLWVKADDIVAGIGDSVSLWEDQSPNNFDAIQANTINKPILEYNTLNHLPSVRFDGANDILSSGNVDLHVDQRYSSFIIAKPADFLASRNMFSKGATTGQGNVSLRTTSTGRFSSIVDGEIKTGTQILTPNKYYLFDCIVAPDTVSLDVNAVDELKYVPSVDLFGTNTSSFQIGASAGTSFWLGNISELLIFKKKLNEPERKQVQNYLMDKYAPPVNLGADISSCVGTNIRLNARNDESYVSYLWSNGSTDSFINITRTGIYSVQVVDVFNRVSSDTVIVKFENTIYTSFAMPDTAVCLGTAIDLSAGPSYLDYIWYNGDSTNLSNFSSGGRYWVSVTDCQSNTFTDTFDLTQVDIRFNLGTDTFLCLGDALALSPNAIRPVSYLWNTGSTSASIFATSEDNYWCQVRDSLLGCFSTDSIYIDIDSFKAFTFLGADTSMCNGNTLSLASGSSLVSTIVWSTTSTSTSTTVTLDGNYSFVAIDSQGCSATDTINVRIKGNAPFVDFIADDLCEGDTLITINLSSTLLPDVISSYVWNFGDGYIDSSIAPTHFYDSTGVYLVGLIATTDSGCSNYNSHLVSYSKNPIARVASIIACAMSDVVFTDASVIPAGYSIASYSWNINGTTSSAPTITYDFPTSGRYPLSLSITTSGGCTDSTNDSFEVFPAMNIDFASTGACYGDTTKFTDVTGSFSIIQREWIFGLGLGYAFNTPTPNFTFPSPGSYLVSFKAKNAIGCTDSIVKYVTIYNEPQAFFVDSIACLNASKTFVDRSISVDDTIDYWHWTIDTSNYFSQNVNHTSTSTGSYIANLEIQTIHGCTDAYSRTVSISPAPVADFSYTPNYGVAPLPIFFTNNSVGATSYVWYFNDSSNASSSAISPSFTFLENDNYLVTLVASSDEGCVDSVVKMISVQPSDLDLLVDEMQIYETVTSTGLIQTKVEVRLVNIGSRIINNATLLARIENGNIISENWTGTLLPGEFQTYLFNASFLIGRVDLNRYICAEAIDVNDGSETNIFNNKVCKNNQSQGVSSEIYPNPANQEANVDVVLVQDEAISIVINNELGQAVYPLETYEGKEGMNHFVFNTNMLSNGHYYFTIKYFASEERRKFQVSR